MVRRHDERRNNTNQSTLKASQPEFGSDRLFCQYLIVTIWLLCATTYYDHSLFYAVAATSML